MCECVQLIASGVHIVHINLASSNSNRIDCPILLTMRTNLRYLYVLRLLLTLIERKLIKNQRKVHYGLEI